MARNDQGPVGQFLWNTTTGQWHWDKGMFEVHGYQEGAVVVDTDLVLEHKAHEHRARAEELLGASASGDQRFSNYHDIVDASGRRRTVLVVGESCASTSGPTVSYRLSRGFMVDVTRDEGERTRHAVDRARQSTAPIQQSMGLLMGSLGLTEDAARAVLVRVSQHHNVKMRDLARRFISAAVSSAAESPRDLSQVLLAQAVVLATERAHEGESRSTVSRRRRDA